MSDENGFGDSPPAPSWINKELLQKALRNSGEENGEVTAFTVNFALGPGDNCASTMYRVKITLSNGEQRSLIAKGLPSGASMRELIEERGIFHRETIMLTEIIPQIQALLNDVAPGRFLPFAPQCPLHGESPEEFLVLEDLSEKGFRLAKKLPGLGLRHSILALRNLGRFHGASHALLRKRPELYQRLTNRWMRDNQGMQAILDGGLQAAADVCRTWPGFEKYAVTIEDFKSRALQCLTDLNDPKPGGFHVICHGDFWSSNMMFRYEEGIPVEQITVDLQLAHVASPATDFIYFVAGSISENVHINYLDLLVREYHHELKETMSLLELEAPSLKEFQADLDAHGSIAAYTGVCGIPIMRNDIVPDIEARINGDNSSEGQRFGSFAVQRWMKRIIPEYIEKGWISS